MKQPLIRTRHRQDGWTPERQRAYLAALRETGSITRACAVVGLSRASLYALRNRPDATRFNAACDAAYAAARAAKAQVIEAISAPVIRHGRQVAVRTRFAGIGPSRPPRDWLAEAANYLHLVNFRPLGAAGEGSPHASIVSTSAPAPLAPAARVP